MPTHSERCFRESTRDVVFLLQRRRRIFFHDPEGYTRDSANDYCWVKVDDNDNIIESDTDISEDEVVASDPECCEVVWNTESVWLDRDEAEAYGEAHSYHYFPHPEKGVGWRVYGMPSYGDLAKLLRAQDEVKETPCKS